VQLEGPPAVRRRPYQRPASSASKGHAEQAPRFVVSGKLEEASQGLVHVYGEAHVYLGYCRMTPRKNHSWPPLLSTPVMNSRLSPVSIRRDGD
jgi:hypothetical protein